ncbi:MAG: efflux RND transporter permease subunit [Planctomycetes bacterium]|nr:efflux RND transporter permease subunit [Planctomycetota bacterium]MBI3833070.1 efflux RND transporter permease subunit [Planctomycetota bacterium]
MVKRLVYFALHQPLFLCMLALLFITGGLVAFRSLPIEAFPDVTDVQATVISLFPGHAPEEVEKQVTIPLEIELSGLPHAVRMFSHTQFGLSYIVITFDDQVGDYFARQQTLERLVGADLPPGVQPQLAPLSTAIGEIFRYRVRGDNLSSTDLRSLQDWVISREFKRIPGVADVVSMGGLIKQYQVSIDLGRMKSYNISLQQVMTALGRGSANAGGSYIEQGAQQYLIRGIGLLRSAEDIENILLEERQGTPLRIKDVAQVVVSGVPRQGIIGQDDNDDMVAGIILMRKGENPSEVLKGVKARGDKLNGGMLPAGVKLVKYYDRAVLIDRTLHTVFKNLVEGALLVTLVLYLFLGNLRAAAIVAVIIPLALLATFIGLTLRGIPANLLSLGAMDFGIIVDGAVIVVENVFRCLTEHHGKHTRESARETILEATAQVGRPTLFSMLIIIIAYIPIFTLQRQEGRIFAPMAYTVVSALIGSLLFSLTLVPLLCYFLLRWRLHEKENPLIRFCKWLYRPTLRIALKLRWLVLSAALAGLAGSLLLVPKLGSEFLPELNEGSIWINLTLPPSISVSETTRICHKLRDLIRQFPEVNSVISKAGRPEDGTDPKLINMAEVLVDTKPEEKWAKGVTKEQLIARMEAAIRTIPGLNPSFSQPIRDNVLESISQIDGQIVIKVFGEDLSVLREKAEAVLDTIKPIRGVAFAAIDRAGRSPQLQIEINRERAARYGLNVADVQDVIETALGGKAGTEIWEGEKKFSVVVRLDDKIRRDMMAIRNIPVDTPRGTRIPLDEVADIGVRDGSINISRESAMRMMAVSVFLRGRDMGSLVEEMQQRVAADVTLPTGFYLTWGGEFENQQRAMARLQVIVPVSIFLIFVLLFDAFKSVKDAILILLNVPLALIGGILALYLTGIHLSVSAAIGFIALFGQAVLNGVVMVSYFKQLRADGMALKEAIVTGGLVRLRTVLMTALLAMLGLLPMALSHEIGAEVQRPLAVVVIGGLVSATLLTLVVLPVIYFMMQVRSERGAISEAI